MHSQPLVSVIMNFLDADEFIQEAIESVFAQTYHPWELLLVDDGSSDGSTDLARGYTDRNSPRVQYLEHTGHQNRGTSASRNLGIRHAQGEYIAFLDADDVWLPHKLEQQVAILASQPEATALYGNTQYWYSWTGKPEDLKRDFMPKLGVPPNTLIAPPKLLSRFLRGNAAVPCTCSIMARREVIEGIGGFEDAFPGMYDDQVFYAKLCLAAPVFVAGACWDRYRQHSASSSYIAENAGQMHSARRAYLGWLANYLSQQGIKDTEVWQALREELQQYDDSTWPGMSRLTRYFRRRTRKLLSRLRQGEE